MGNANQNAANVRAGAVHTAAFGARRFGLSGMDRLDHALCATTAACFTSTIKTCHLGQRTCSGAIALMEQLDSGVSARSWACRELIFHYNSIAMYDMG